MVVGNVISPRIQGQAVRVHPMLVFFAVIAGGALFGMPGVVLAVPAMAVLRVLYDFLRVRVRVADETVVGLRERPARLTAAGRRLTPYRREHG
jgi:predicted PurR-regulated permease PerM